MKKPIKTVCYGCAYRRELPGTAHSQCINPDPEMRGLPYGIENGWFFYPDNYDPVWRTRECANHTQGPKQPAPEAAVADKNANTCRFLLMGGHLVETGPIHTSNPTNR